MAITLPNVPPFDARRLDATLIADSSFHRKQQPSKQSH